MMFDPSPAPRVFAMPPGVDFPQAVADGLMHRMRHQPPEAIARVDLWVNTARMQARIAAALTKGKALLLPNIRIISSLGQSAVMDNVAPAVPALRRRLELTRLISRLIDADETVAPRSAIYDLSDSLAALMEEMQGEGVDLAALARLDLTGHSDHWNRSRDFIQIIAPYFTGTEAPGSEARQRMAVEQLVAAWHAVPPGHPVLVAGSTGSRGTTALLMQAVARLPQGALILPGFDDQMPHVWGGLSDAFTGEDHPQYRFRRLMDALAIDPGAIAPWVQTPPPSVARNRLVSLSLRPAPVTDQWMVEAPLLGDLRLATAGMVLIECASPRQEALAVAFRLRAALEQGQKAALITPDRTLARQVTAALQRWHILPDDSAGQPLALSAPGRFLRHIAALYGRKLTAEALLILLKHPICASGADRGTHLLYAHDLELILRRYGPQFPRTEDLLRWARDDAARQVWAHWLAARLAGLEAAGPAPLLDHVTRHIALAEGLARGPDGSGDGDLWLAEAGREALAAARELLAEAPYGGTLSASDYTDLFTAILMRREVRSAVKPHPDVMIWGTLDARAQGADLVVLAGLNDGIWPPSPPPDPWMNRKMRYDAGLLLPERRIGLSAHDYQQAVAAPQVVLTRAVRDAEAETVVSRWLNRLCNLLQGSPGTDGPAALAMMRQRGQDWLGLVAAAEAVTDPVPAETRPAPQPPVADRPRELFVTQISRLIRDPYAIYARHILRLKKLDPLHAPPDLRDRGTTLHRILQAFVEGRQPETPGQARARLLDIADTILLRDIPWPVARRLWRARLERVTDWFLQREAELPGTPAILEKEGSATLQSPAFTLSAKPDRIDLLPDGRLMILDYKTGSLPTKKVQAHFDKQLSLEAAMAERGAFVAVGARPVAQTLYVGLGSDPKIDATDWEPGELDAVWRDFAALIARYMQRKQGYAARRAVERKDILGDYDHLARYGEWQDSDPVVPVIVGKAGDN